MALYLNTNAAYKDFQMLRNDPYFVDKSALIEKISERIKTKNRFLCVTKPHRFGKTSVLNMLGAYYGKAFSSGPLFDGLEISKSKSFTAHTIPCLRNTSDLRKRRWRCSAGGRAVYSAMIIYGLLSYHEGTLSIPNQELMLEFEAALEDDDFG